LLSQTGTIIDCVYPFVVRVAFSTSPDCVALPLGLHLAQTVLKQSYVLSANTFLDIDKH